MKLFLSVILAAASLAPNSATGATDGAGFEACESELQARCTAEYEEARQQCDRYYLRETEAFALCHESSEKRNQLCMSRGEQACAQAQPNGGGEQ